MNKTLTIGPERIIEFWFEELKPEDWFKKSNALDERITNEFRELHKLATEGELSPWRETMEGRLAEILVLDQFSRNIFRGRAESFAYDKMALELSKRAVSTGQANELPSSKQAFLYMPFMHSEAAKDHEEALKLFSAPGLENNLAFERKHKEIIDRFGRYPHRNELLGRTSTPEELEFLKGPGSSF